MRDVELTIAIRQRMQGEETITTLTHHAGGTAKGASFFVRYREQMEDGGETTAVLRVEEDEVSLLRQGSVQMKQVFRKGAGTRGMYTTPYGAFQMDTHTRLLRIERKDGVPSRVVIAYQMWLNEQYIGDFEMDVCMVWKELMSES
jgi:uncharacterized beta-barrel protein YwiB (DUF1934 family)